MVHKRGLILNARDNVASVLEEVLPGETVEVRSGDQALLVEATEKIPFGFKIAVEDVDPGEPVVKYGERIGQASRAINRGELVHIHNLSGARGRGDIRENAAGR